MNLTNSSLAALPVISTTNMLLPTLWMRIVAAFVDYGCALVGGTGNIMVLLAFAFNRSLWIKQNVYLFCLTVSDLYVAMVAAPMAADQFLIGRFRGGRGSCRAMLIFSTLMFCSSLNFVALISRDRMLMVVKGAAYDAYETTARKWLHVCINVVGLLIALIPYHSYDLLSGFSLFDMRGKCQPEQLQNIYLTIANQFVFAMLPFLFMLYYYASVRRYFRKVAPAAPSTRNTAHFSKSNGIVVTSVAVPIVTESTLAKIGKARRAAKIMNVLLVSMLFSALPATIMSLFMNVLFANPKMVEPSTMKWLTDFYLLTFTFGYIANAMNPFLYAYAMPAYREAARNVARLGLNFFKK